MAARQSVKSQLHVGKQPTENQAVKNRSAEDLALPNSKKQINFSIPTKIVVAARQSVKSQLHVGKQPTENQAVKIGQPKTSPYQTPKRDVRATT